MAENTIWLDWLNQAKTTGNLLLKTDPNNAGAVELLKIEQSGAAYFFDQFTRSWTPLLSLNDPVNAKYEEYPKKEVVVGTFVKIPSNLEAVYEVTEVNKEGEYVVFVHLKRLSKTKPEEVSVMYNMIPLLIEVEKAEADRILRDELWESIGRHYDEENKAALYTSGDIILHKTQGMGELLDNFNVTTDGVTAPFNQADNIIKIEDVAKLVTPATDRFDKKLSELENK
ncbi:hypothetical protein [Bacillus phage Nachito]|nr:hypothetical protein [Bacillus phage Nachito]